MRTVLRELDDEIGRTGAVSEMLYERVWAAMEAHDGALRSEDLALLATLGDRGLAMVVSIATRVMRGAATWLALVAWARLIARLPAAAPYSESSWNVLEPFVEAALVQTAFAPFDWASADAFAGSARALSGEDAVVAAIAMWALGDRPTRPLPEVLLRDARRWRDSGRAPACLVAARIV